MGGVLLVAFGLATPVLTTIATFILPETFASSTKIIHRTGNPATLAAAVEKITSPAVLDPVIDDLNLRAEWGRKYKQAPELPMGMCHAILKVNIKVSQPARTSLIDIRVFSDNKDEAALIANKIAVVYCQATPGANIIALAQLNPRPVRPNKPRNILLGLFVGIVFAALGIGLLLAARKSKTALTTTGSNC